MTWTVFFFPLSLSCFSLNVHSDALVRAEGALIHPFNAMARSIVWNWLTVSLFLFVSFHVREWVSKSRYTTQYKSHGERQNIHHRWLYVTFHEYDSSSTIYSQSARYRVRFSLLFFTSSLLSTESNTISCHAVFSIAQERHFFLLFASNKLTVLLCADVFVEKKLAALNNLLCFSWEMSGHRQVREGRVAVALVTL